MKKYSLESLRKQRLSDIELCYYNICDYDITQTRIYLALWNLFIFNNVLKLICCVTTNSICIGYNFENVNFKSRTEYNGNEFKLVIGDFLYPNPLTFSDGMWIDNNYQTLIELYYDRTLWI